MADEDKNESTPPEPGEAGSENPEPGPGAAPEQPQSERTDQVPEPAEGQAEQVEAQAGQVDQADLDAIMPDRARGVLIPFTRVRIPMKVYLGIVGALTLVCALVSVPVLVRRGARTRPGPRAVGDAQAGNVPLVEPIKQLLPYDELMRRGQAFIATGDHLEAAKHYRAASERDEEGPAMVAHARFELARALTEIEEYDEAARILQELAAQSRPTEQLWKHATAASIAVLTRRGREIESWRQISRLQAFADHYRAMTPPDADAERLDAWLLYCKAMVRMRGFAALAGDDGLYGQPLPDYGRAPCPCETLDPSQIVVHEPGLTTPGMHVDTGANDLLIEAQNVPLERMIAVLAEWGEMEVRYQAARAHEVSCYMNVTSAENALDIILGTVGLQADLVGPSRIERAGAKQVVLVRELELAPRTVEQARKAAAAALDGLIWTHADSPYIGEAYFAKLHLLVSERTGDDRLNQEQGRLILDQAANMPSDFRNTLWAAYTHYVAGRAAMAIGDWVRAEQELMRCYDSLPGHPLKLSAMRCAGQAQMAQGKHKRAAWSFRKCLTLRPGEELMPELLLQEALCKEASGLSRAEMDDLYLELRSRFPGTAQARLANYRLARMQFDAQKWASAAVRYEFFLAESPGIRDEVACDAAAELLLCYAELGEDYPLCALGVVMADVMAERPQFQRSVPILLDGCRRTGMIATAMRIVAAGRQKASDPTARWQLGMAKARFLLDLARYQEVQELLADLESHAPDDDRLRSAWLLKARVLLAQGRADRGLMICCAVATRPDSPEQIRAEALRVMGGYYESLGEFAKAALVYSGQCPIHSEGGTP